MRLLVIRHGKAEERDPDRFPDDGLRPLTTAGLREIGQLGPALITMGFVIDTLYSSPITRAWETALGLHQSAEAIPAPIPSDLLGYDFALDSLFALLAGHSADSTIAVVGHEPDLSLLVGASIGVRPEIEMKKAAVASIRFAEDPGRALGTLEMLLPPKRLMPLLD